MLGMVSPPLEASGVRDAISLETEATAGCVITSLWGWGVGGEGKCWLLATKGQFGAIFIATKSNPSGWKEWTMVAKEPFP